MSQIPETHRGESPHVVHCAVITVSDTRTLETDSGGKIIVDLLSQAGHKILLRQIILDDALPMRELLISLRERPDIEAILMTGGTGLSARDRTFETVEALLDKTLPGYGELFRMLSYQQIGPAAMLSRATGGLIGHCVLLTMPGSPAAVQLAMEQIILPELGHLVGEARK